MTLDVAMMRVSELQTMLAPSVPVTARGTAGAASAASGAASPTSFAAMLGQPAAAPGAGSPNPSVGGTGAGRAALAVAQAEVGQAEQPPGSNDSPRIAQYRKATAGSMVAPWCAYFVSWAAREAGAPLGDSGQGFGAVSDVWDWGQRTGKAFTPDQRPPQAGDLIVWDGRHMGMVESVGADGSVHTIEGNSSDSVIRRVHGPDGDGATGYVRLG